MLDVFVPLMIAMSQKGISFVVDQVLQKDASEADIIDKLRPHAYIVNIHTTCSNPIERYKERIAHSESRDITERREFLLKRAVYHEPNLDNTSQPLVLNVPLLAVNTDDGYDPSVEAVVDFIKKNYAA